MQDRPGGGLVLGGAITLPAAPDHHDARGPPSRASATALALTKAPEKIAGAPSAASVTLVPFVVDSTTIEPGFISAAETSVGELPKSKPFTLALPRSPILKSAPG